jgi:integrase
MPRLQNRVPKYSHHKKSGRGVIRFASRDVYLPGAYGSEESRAAYDRWIARWLANGRSLPESESQPESASPSALTIDELIVRYLGFAQEYYRRPDGGRTSELGNMKDALRLLHLLYGETPAGAFGKRQLKALRDRMIDSGLARPTINARVMRVRRVFAWGAEEDLVPASICADLKALKGLQTGRTRAKEPKPIKPVPDAWVDAVLPLVSPQVAAVIGLLRLTGARPSEILTMRAVDLDVSGPTWTYRPGQHKTAHRGKGRTIHLGPRAQGILRPWLRTNLQEYLFRPEEAEAHRKARMRLARKSPVQPSQVDRSRRGVRCYRQRYDTMTLGQAITRACRKAGVPEWAPGQLRHTVATEVRKTFGLEEAQVILGHSRADVTQVYAETHEQLAAEVMLKIG